jgi:hypothetical protein
MKQKLIELILWLGIFLSPIYPTMIAIGFLLSADFIVGIWAAHKAGEKITSRKMSNTISKIFLYNFTIIVLFVSEKFLVPEIPFVRIGAGLIGLVEIKSLSENVYKATGLNLWKSIKEYINRKKDA